MQRATRWALEEFGSVNLGDARRPRRLTMMADAAWRRPAGKVSAVFERAAEREGAYDFLENRHVRPEAIAAGMFEATARRAAKKQSVYVAIDHTSLTLTDVAKKKGFGPIRWKRGLMVVNALAVASDGVPLGLIDQRFWTRKPVEDRTHREVVARNRKRRFQDKEPYAYARAAKNAVERLRSKECRPWIVIDRIADNAEMLAAVDKTGARFTVRGGRERVLLPPGAPSLQRALDQAPSLGKHVVSIGRSGCRPARTVVVDVRAARVIVPLRRGQRRIGRLELSAVRLRDAEGEVEWVLYTNAPVVTVEEAREVVASYEARWRVEEFHKTWKSGQCNVEDAQLRSKSAVVKWATILAAVATRVERLKYLSRTTPEVPATVELADDEIEGLKLDQTQRRRRKQRDIPDKPSIGEATKWIGELGGWLGERNGPPGSIVLARGLQRLAWLVEGIAIGRGRLPGPET
jgi:hypothetical protein